MCPCEMSTTAFDCFMEAVVCLQVACPPARAGAGPGGHQWNWQVHSAEGACRQAEAKSRQIRRELLGPHTACPEIPTACKRRLVGCMLLAEVGSALSKEPSGMCQGGEAPRLQGPDA